MAKLIFVMCALSMPLNISLAEGLFIDSPNLMVRELKYDPFPIESGQYVTIWIKLDNYGSEKAKNATCELLPRYPFSLDPDDDGTRNIGILNGLESAIMDFRLYVDSKAVEGYSELDIRCRSSEKDPLVTRTIDLYVSSDAPEFAIGSMESVPSKLFSDTEDNELRIAVTNVGTGSAELVSVKLILPEGIIPSESYSNVANLGILPSGSSSEAMFHIDLGRSVEPKTHKATLEISYRDEGSRNSRYRTQLLEADINVRPSPIMEVLEINTTPAEISQGDPVTLRVKVSNEGYEEAKSVSLRVYKQNDQPFELDEKYDFIGNLGPGESGDALLKLTVDEEAATKTHLLEGEIRYVVGSEVFVVNRQIPVRVDSAKESSQSGLLVGGLLFLLLLAAVVYYVRVKKR
ncbi:MAG: COG1361 S-layer family protein [Candidatus Aenigmarchaeota archaeon]|nr:COG1361 S-layer family protein [Candidatus Aenigmarchaeota archaeon]